MPLAGVTRVTAVAHSSMMASQSTSPNFGPLVAMSISQLASLMDRREHHLLLMRFSSDTNLSQQLLSSVKPQSISVAVW